MKIAIISALSVIMTLAFYPSKSDIPANTLSMGDSSLIPHQVLKQLEKEHPEYTEAELCEVYSQNKEYYDKE